MLHRFKLLLKRFQRDERGAFLVLFGVLAIALIATSGAVVDFTQIEQARTRAQNALDAAALGLQPRVFDTPAHNQQWFIDEAELLLIEQLADNRVTVDVTGATINVREGQLILNARITVPTAFVALVGVPSVSARLVSEATRKRLNLEVAMVLDNSGSMASYSRMSELIKAAKLAADILFDNQPTQPNVFMSVIPFTQYVNVGTANRTASWMSQTGASSVSHLNFDNDEWDGNTFSGPVNRWALYDGFNNESWEGCVEARVAPFDTNDEVPNNAVPDTMFQPVFAPDTRVDNYLDPDPKAQCTRNEPKWIWTETKYSCNKDVNDPNTAAQQWNDQTCDGASPTHLFETVSELGAVTSSTTNSTPPAELYHNPFPGTYQYSSVTHSGTGSGSNRTNKRTITWTYWFSTKEYEQRLCKYKGASFSGDGPNSDCPNTAMLPLSNNRDTVKGRIGAMIADGSTNIEQGAIWGFHSLSPTEPLTEGRDYDEATSKIMIVMTDGENNVNYSGYSGSNPYGVSSWTAWGYRSDWRLLTETTTPKDSVATGPQVIAEVNRRTVLACANAKAKGIKVYTIGLSVPNQTTTDMLNACASPNETINGQVVDYSQFTTDSTQLTAIFRKIAEQLSELRLAQ